MVLHILTGALPDKMSDEEKKALKKAKKAAHKEGSKKGEKQLVFARRRRIRCLHSC